MHNNVFKLNSKKYIFLCYGHVIPIQLIYLQNMLCEQIFISKELLKKFYFHKFITIRKLVNLHDVKENHILYYTCHR